MTAENRVRAGLTGGIDAVVKAIKTRISNPGVCYRGCGVLWNISWGSTIVQKEAYEKGGLGVLLRVLKEHSDDENISGSCCAAIGVVLSSPEVYFKVLHTKGNQSC